MFEKMPRNKVQLYFDDDIFKVLGEIAKIETRSVPNLSEALVIEALRQRGVIETPTFSKIKDKEKE